MKNLVRARTFDDLFLSIYMDNFRPPEAEPKARVNTMAADDIPTLKDIL
jgi:hypothetical protein